MKRSLINTTHFSIKLRPPGFMFYRLHPELQPDWSRGGLFKKKKRARNKITQCFPKKMKKEKKLPIS